MTIFELTNTRTDLFHCKFRANESSTKNQGKGDIQSLTIISQFIRNAYPLTIRLIHDAVILLKT